MAWRSGKQKYFRKADVDCKCGHPGICHYTKGGYCVFEKCECKEFKGMGRPEFNRIKRSHCQYGHAHNSGTEIKVCSELHFQKLAGDIKGFEAEKVINLLGPSSSQIGTYRIDFVVQHNDGTTEFIEVKGDHLTRAGSWALKWSILQDMFKGDPKYKFRVVRG